MAEISTAFLSGSLKQSREQIVHDEVELFMSVIETLPRLPQEPV